MKKTHEKSEEKIDALFEKLFSKDIPEKVRAWKRIGFQRLIKSHEDIGEPVLDQLCKKYL